MGDELVTGSSDRARRRDAPALRVREVALTVIDVDAELSTFGEQRADRRATPSGRTSSVRIPVPDDVDLTQPVAVTIRTADGARSIVLHRSHPRPSATMPVAAPGRYWKRRWSPFLRHLTRGCELAGRRSGV
ncbi:MAG: hypothetical protein R2697_11300 [Ilumatobacteraceae bacterium]